MLRGALQVHFVTDKAVIRNIFWANSRGFLQSLPSLSFLSFPSVFIPFPLAAAAKWNSNSAKGYQQGRTFAATRHVRWALNTPNVLLFGVFFEPGNVSGGCKCRPT